MRRYGKLVCIALSISSYNQDYLLCINWFHPTLHYLDEEKNIFSEPTKLQKACKKIINTILLPFTFLHLPFPNNVHLSFKFVGGFDIPKERHIDITHYLEQIITKISSAFIYQIALNH